MLGGFNEEFLGVELELGEEVGGEVLDGVGKDAVDDYGAVGDLVDVIKAD